jgi:hypothetical protein
VVSVVIGACALSGCGVGGADGDADAESPPPVSSMSTSMSTSIVDADAPAVPDVDTTAVETDDEPDAELVAACTEFVQFQAYVGDADGVAIWTRAGETAEGLDALCRQMVLEDADAVLDMRDELADADAGAAEADVASTTLAPGCHGSYGGCLPIVTDIDCVRDRDGDGPVYQGLSVLVLGHDEYEIDRDGDGLACEPGDH